MGTLGLFSQQNKNANLALKPVLAFDFNDKYIIIGNTELTRSIIFTEISMYLSDPIKKYFLGFEFLDHKAKKYRAPTEFEISFQQHNILMTLTELIAYGLTLKKPAGAAAYSKNQYRKDPKLKAKKDKYYNDLIKIKELAEKLESEDGNKVFHPEIDSDIKRIQDCASNLLEDYKTSAIEYKQNIFDKIISYMSGLAIDESELFKILEEALLFFEGNNYKVFKSANEIEQELKKYRKHLLSKKDASVSYEQVVDKIYELEILDPDQKFTKRILEKLLVVKKEIEFQKNRPTLNSNLEGLLPSGVDSN